MGDEDATLTAWRRIGTISMRLVESALLVFSLMWLFGLIH